MRHSVVAGLVLLLLGACVPQNPKVPAVAEPFSGIVGEESLGIRVTGLRRTAEGYMLDFRYRVLDPSRSAPLLDRSIKPTLIDEATGARFVVPGPPKIGPLRQTTRNPEAGRIYFVLFANPGKYLEPGSRVTVAFGDHRIEHLVVE